MTKKIISLFMAFILLPVFFLSNIQALEFSKPRPQYEGKFKLKIFKPDSGYSYMKYGFKYNGYHKIDFFVDGEYGDYGYVWPDTYTISLYDSTHTILEKVSLNKGDSVYKDAKKLVKFLNDMYVTLKNTVKFETTTLENAVDFSETPQDIKYTTQCIEDPPELETDKRIVAYDFSMNGILEQPKGLTVEPFEDKKFDMSFAVKNDAGEEEEMFAFLKYEHLDALSLSIEFPQQEFYNYKLNSRTIFKILDVDGKTIRQYVANEGTVVINLIKELTAFYEKNFQYYDGFYVSADKPGDVRLYGSEPESPVFFGYTGQNFSEKIKSSTYFSMEPEGLVEKQAVQDNSPKTQNIGIDVNLKEVVGGQTVERTETLNFEMTLNSEGKIKFKIVDKVDKLGSLKSDVIFYMFNPDLGKPVLDGHIKANESDVSHSFEYVFEKLNLYDIGVGDGMIFESISFIDNIPHEGEKIFSVNGVKTNFFWINVIEEGFLVEFVRS